MVDYKISYRYASSLLGTAEEKNILSGISDDFELLKLTLEENPQLERMLGSPVIKPQVKKSVLKEIFSSKVDEETLVFLNFVIEKNREDLLYNIVQKFLELRDEKLGIVNLNVKTAFEFSDEQKNKLQDKMEKFLNKKVRIKFETDERIVGGFVARVADTVYDASLRHQLDLLKKQFLSGSKLN